MLSLLIVAPASTSTVPVPADGALVIGRAVDCDLQIDDAGLSRRHLKLEPHPDGSVVVTDLGSRNGTSVRDERIEAQQPVRVEVGMSIRLGGTLILVQRDGHGGRSRDIWGHEYFERRLARACDEAAAEQPVREFAVLRLRWRIEAGHATNDGPDAAQMLDSWLEERDVVARCAPAEYELLCPTTGSNRLGDRVAGLVACLARSGTTVRIASAVFPRDGTAPDALLAHTRHGLRDEVDGPVSTPSPPELGRLAPMIAKVAAGSIHVLILGETGAGKEVMARRIHAMSPRAAMPLVSINCAAISESLLESELFGHEKGAFTGAVSAKAGLLESANGGTVLLDEIGEMPLGLQAKLLRVVEQREVTRVGALRPRPIDVRYLSATNRDLEADAAMGRFRLDLYFRINGIAISLPSLRERIDELEPLATLFVADACRATGRPAARIDPAALDALKRYAWPGNIRELKNMMDRAVLLSSGRVITLASLPADRLRGGVPAAATPIAASTAAPLAPPAPVAAPQTPSWSTDAERRRVEEALDACGGNQSQAAKRLGVSRGTFIKRIKEFGIRRPRQRA